MAALHRLTVWAKAHELALHTLHVVPLGGPHPDVSALLRRAAISVPCLIAHGAAQATHPLFVAGLERALGRAREAAYLVRLSAEVGALSPSERARTEARADEVCKMLAALRSRLTRPRPERRAAGKSTRKRGES